MLVSQTLSVFLSQRFIEPESARQNHPGIQRTERFFFLFLDRASMRYPRSCRAAASLSHVFLARSRRQAMATTAPLLSPQHACPAHLPRCLPPLHLSSRLDVPARRVRLRRAPPPCTAKFGKFDASDAPAEAEGAEAAADGGVAQPAEEDDRSGSLHPQLVRN